MWQRCLPYISLAVAVFAVYSNIYGNVFLFDDDLLIRLNTYLRSWDTFRHLLTASTTEGAHIAGGFYRPLQNLLYFFIFQIGGEQPFGFHLLNVALHAANACLGYRLALKLGLDPRAALAGMLIWAVHPLHTEAVTYMSGTADPLFVFFGLWSLNVLMPEPSTKRIWQSLPLFVLALLSKETAVVFPALAVVCLYFSAVGSGNVGHSRFEARGPGKNPRTPNLEPRGTWLLLKTVFATWPLWLTAMVYLAWRVSSSDFDGPTRYTHLFGMPEYATMKLYAENPLLRFTTFLATLPAYAQLLLWPVDLHMERSFPLQDDWLSSRVLGGLVMLLAAAAEIVWARRGAGLAVAWGLLWFGAAHAPNTGLLFPMNSLFLEHWMYLPTIGLCLGLAEVAVTLLDRYKIHALNAASLAVALAAGGALAAHAYDQNTIWHDPVVFYTNIFSYGVVSPRAHNNLAIAYMDRHDLPKAIEEYRRAIREGDTYAETHYNLALALLAMSDQKPQLTQAIAELERSLEIEPRFYRSFATLAQIYLRLGEPAKAETYRRKAEEALAGMGAQ